MKIIKCLLALTVINLFTLEITEIDLYSDVQRNQKGPVTEYWMEFSDQEGKKEVSVFHNKETDKYWKTQKIFSPRGVKVQAIYESPRQLKAQFDRLKTKYNTDHGIETQSSSTSLQELLDRLSLAEQEYLEAKKSYVTGPSSRSNINK